MNLPEIQENAGRSRMLDEVARLLSMDGGKDYCGSAHQAIVRAGLEKLPPESRGVLMGIAGVLAAAEEARMPVEHRRFIHRQLVEAYQMVTPECSLVRAIGWRSYERFILGALESAGGNIAESLLDEMIQRAFESNFNELDLERDHRGVPRWKQYVAFAKSRLTRTGLNLVVVIDGRSERRLLTVRPKKVTRKGLVRHWPGSRFASYRRPQPLTRDVEVLP